mmetsp:Transcript_16943/g.30696  ORF Transcript_16943/g.30696 Transcript_16943/m.30696 type:complete len:159 (+) Transcript_16943:71-547(+)
MLCLFTLSLLLARSNASLLLRGSNEGMNGEEPKKERKLASGDGTSCGEKLSAETMIAFGLDPLMNCTEISRSDIPCVPITDLNGIVPDPALSTCVTSEDCASPMNCFYLPNPGGTASQPAANCFVDRDAAADWVALQPDGEPVNVDVPKEICRELGGI